MESNYILNFYEVRPILNLDSNYSYNKDELVRAAVKNNNCKCMNVQVLPLEMLEDVPEEREVLLSKGTEVHYIERYYDLDKYVRSQIDESIDYQIETVVLEQIKENGLSECIPIEDYKDEIDIDYLLKKGNYNLKLKVLLLDKALMQKHLKDIDFKHLDDAEHMLYKVSTLPEMPDAISVREFIVSLKDLKAMNIEVQEVIPSVILSATLKYGIKIQSGVVDTEIPQKLLDDAIGSLYRTDVAPLKEMAQRGIINSKVIEAILEDLGSYFVYTIDTIDEVEDTEFTKVIEGEYEDMNTKEEFERRKAMEDKRDIQVDNKEAQIVFNNIMQKLYDMGEISELDDKYKNDK